MTGDCTLDLLGEDLLPAGVEVGVYRPGDCLREGESTGGNEVGSLLANLGTDLSDPAERLKVVNASMKDNKEVFKSLPEVQQMALSAYNSTPMMLELIPVLKATARPPFNIAISNVPGSRDRLYWGGAELVGNYPMSIVLDGQALNITLTNTADRIDPGIVGCRSSVPHLQRLLVHLEDSLSDLERAVGQKSS